MTTLLEKYDKIFSKGHGGGNWRRLVEQFREELKKLDKIPCCGHGCYCNLGASGDKYEGAIEGSIGD